MPFVTQRNNLWHSKLSHYAESGKYLPRLYGNASARSPITRRGAGQATEGPVSPPPSTSEAPKVSVHFAKSVKGSSKSKPGLRPALKSKSSYRSSGRLQNAERLASKQTTFVERSLLPAVRSGKARSMKTKSAISKRSGIKYHL